MTIAKNLPQLIFYKQPMFIKKFLSGKYDIAILLFNQNSCFDVFRKQEISSASFAKRAWNVELYQCKTLFLNYSKGLIIWKWAGLVRLGELTHLGGISPSLGSFYRNILCSCGRWASPPSWFCWDLACNHSRVFQANSGFQLR